MNAFGRHFNSPSHNQNPGGARSLDAIQFYLLYAEARPLEYCLAGAQTNALENIGWPGYMKQCYPSMVFDVRSLVGDDAIKGWPFGAGQELSCFDLQSEDTAKFLRAHVKADNQAAVCNVPSALMSSVVAYLKAGS